MSSPINLNKDPSPLRQVTLKSMETSDLFDSIYDGYDSEDSDHPVTLSNDVLMCVRDECDEITRINMNVAMGMTALRPGCGGGFSYSKIFSDPTTSDALVRELGVNPSFEVFVRKLGALELLGVLEAPTRLTRRDLSTLHIETDTSALSRQTHYSEPGLFSIYCVVVRGRIVRSVTPIDFAFAQMIALKLYCCISEIPLDDDGAYYCFLLDRMDDGFDDVFWGLPSCEKGCTTDVHYHRSFSRTMINTSASVEKITAVIINDRSTCAESHTMVFDNAISGGSVHDIGGLRLD